MTRSNKIFIWTLFILWLFTGGHFFYFNYFKKPKRKDFISDNISVNKNMKFNNITDADNIFLTGLNGDTVLFNSLSEREGTNILRIPPVSCQLCINDLLSYLSKDTSSQNKYLIIYTISSIRELKSISKMFKLGNLYGTSNKQIFPYDNLGIPYLIKIGQKNETKDILFVKNGQYKGIEIFLNRED